MNFFHPVCSFHLLYGAGDVRQKHLRQVVTAVNDGAIAAQDAFHKIKNL